MSTATSMENAGRTPFSWKPVVVGTGLMIAALIVGLLLQRGSDDAAVQSRAAVQDVTVPEPTADYGIRHLQRTEAPSLEATADWGIRHLRNPVEVQSSSRELDASADYGIRHPQETARFEGPRGAETARLEAAADFYRSLGQRR